MGPPSLARTRRPPTNSLTFTGSHGCLSLEPSTPTEPHSPSRNEPCGAPSGRYLHTRPRGVCLARTSSKEVGRKAWSSAEGGGQGGRGPPRLRPGLLWACSPPPTPTGQLGYLVPKGDEQGTCQPPWEPWGSRLGGGFLPHDERGRPGHPGVRRVGLQGQGPAALGRCWTRGMPAWIPAAPGGHACLHPVHGSLTSPSRTGPRS